MRASTSIIPTRAMLAVAFASLSAAAAYCETSAWVPDLGNGRYRNPVIAADYSDPDVVRVGDDFYLTASSFSNVPGLPILHSRDLVNWTIIGHALPRLAPEGHYATPRRGGGVWAPAIRFHDGRFMIYYPDPDHGIFVITAKDPKGPWSAPILVDDARGAIDPAPFWDADGSGWLVHAYAGSRAGKSNIIMLRRLSHDGTRAIGEARTIIDGATLPAVRTARGEMPWFTIEGPKLYKRNDYYYVFTPAGSVKGGWQGVFRSRHIEGPYEGRDVLDQGLTDLNGPHQGALVETGRGESWFVHFQDTDSYGRRVLLEPVTWQDDWPVIGEDVDGDRIGSPVGTFTKPRLPPSPPIEPQTSDSFAGGRPSLAWQWQSNPGPDWIGSGAPPNILRLSAASTPANLWEAGNLLTQKMPASRFIATVRARLVPRQPGERAGLAMFGESYAWIGLVRDGASTKIVRTTHRDAGTSAAEEIASGPILPRGDTWIWLRLSAEPITIAVPPPAFPHFAEMEREIHARTRFFYSLDGRIFTPLGAPFISRPGRWVGAQIGLFAQAPSGTLAFVANQVGFADFADFTVEPG